MSQSPEIEFMTCKEVCELLRISQPKFSRLATAGDIPAVKIGAEWRVNRARLMAFLDRRTTKSRLRDKAQVTVETIQGGMDESNHRADG